MLVVFLPSRFPVKGTSQTSRMFGADPASLCGPQSDQLGTGVKGFLVPAPQTSMQIAPAAPATEVHSTVKCLTRMPLVCELNRREPAEIPATSSRP